MWSWGGFAGGVGHGLAGVAVGLGIGAVVAATAPPALAVGLALSAAAAGGFMLGQTLYEAASGDEWSMDGNGRALTDCERSSRIGQGLVGIAGLGAMASPWMRAGAQRDAKWLRMPARQRWRDEVDHLTVNGDKYNTIENIPFGERGVRIRDMSPSHWNDTKGSGATSGLRFGSGFGLAGESQRLLSEPGCKWLGSKRMKTSLPEVVIP